jgi:hypothetical protein
MDIDRTDLDKAAAQGVITAPQAEALWSFLTQGSSARAPHFTGLNVAYYFGALIVIAAMGWLTTLGFTAMGPGFTAVVAALYAWAFARTGRKLLQAPETRTPGGLLYTMAVCMTPLFVWSVEKVTGFWPDKDPGQYQDFFPYIRSSWIWMEACTVLAALFALRKVRFSFLVAPAAFALWFMSMDFAAYLSGHSSWDYALSRDVSVAFGLAMLFVAYLADHRTREDLSFWLYLFGMTAFWWGLSLRDSNSELNKAIYCVLNLGFIVLGSLLQRRVFLIYGAIGVNAYLGQLAYRAFKDSLMFPFVLTLMGLAIIATAVKYQKNREAIDAWIDSMVPEWLRAMLPQARVSPGAP